LPMKGVSAPPTRKTRRRGFMKMLQQSECRPSGMGLPARRN